ADREAFPGVLTLAFEKTLDLAYGENPHQRAAYNAESGVRRHLLTMVEQLHGKELSFNNLNDLSAARLLLEEFALPACVIVKHANPCGLALAGSAEEVYTAALAADPVSAYGGIVVQDGDADVDDGEGMAVVCGELGVSHWGDMLFAWRVCKHVSSNAIVLARGLRTHGIGAGQTSRVHSVRIALAKARENGHE